MASPPGDPQRDLVYAVEKLHFAGHARHKLTRKQMLSWIRQICRAYQVSIPSLRVGRCARGHAAEYDPEEESIALDPVQGCNGLTVLHELAHHICTLNHPYASDHGAAFCRIYGELLDQTRLVPFAGWKAVCARHGVKVLRYLPRTG